MTGGEGNAAVEEGIALRGLHALAPWGWRLMVVAVVLLAIYVAAGRYFMQQIPALRVPVLDQLNQRLPFTVDVEQLRGGWSAFSPELRFTGLALSFNDPALKPVLLERGSLRLDVPESIASRTVQFSRLEVAGLSLDARLGSDGAIELIGFGGGDGEALRDWLENFLPNVERVALTENRLAVNTENGVLELKLDLLLERQRNARSVQGRIAGENIEMAVNAQGVGNPLKPLSWSGDVYVDARSTDLGSLNDLWDAMDWPFTLAGAAGAQFWVNRSEGDSRARLRLESAGLALEERSGAWSLPLDALSFEAALEQRARHWSLLTEDFHIERLGQSLDLDRAQFDWWGQALRIRASDLGLDALPSVLAAAPGMPPGLRNALPELAPAGQLVSVELRIDDLAAPAQSWSVRSRLEDFAINSWSERRTPALAGVSGFLRLGPGGGELQLDADTFSMFYPTVYREPLAYDDALGPVRIDWDSSGLRINSGLMTLRGGEGTSHGVFAVDIPFQERVTGVELNLLIGLRDSHVKYRSKYLPYTLPSSLGTWLGQSIENGDIESAGFIWRGSTRKGTLPHKSLQLFADVTNGTLRYDPAWPTLEDLSATVWVDDGRTFGRAPAARTAGTDISDAMVKVLPKNGTALLAVRGDLAGDAQVASVLLGDTPLRDVTNGVFSDWSFAGDLRGSLAIEQWLGQTDSPPTIDLAVNLDGIRARVAQLNLPTTDVTGKLRYQTGSGFIGSDVQGRFLGGSFQTVAREVPLPALELSLAGDVRADAVADWLELPQLNFADGTGAFTGLLTIDEAQGSWLQLESELEGIALDAPEPFEKPAQQPLPLRIAVPLEEDPVLQLALGERVRIDLKLADGDVERLVAAVGGDEPDLSRCDQRYCLGGTVSSLDMLQWQAFYDRYFPVANSDPQIPNRSATGGDTQFVTETTASRPFSYRIDSLDVGELQLGPRSLGGTRVDLWGVDTLWQGAAEASWVQGSLTREGEALQLLIEYLDLERFSGGEPTALADFRDLLPSMRVDVLELRSGERHLGHLGFDLDMDQSDDALYATGIGGELWALDLNGPQPGMLRWDSVDGAEVTTVEIDAAFDDFSDVQVAAELVPTLESEAGNVSVRLSWPGGPTAFAAAEATGSVVLQATNGQVLESRPGALDLISFLNFAEILRGLSLAHMFEAGIPFLTASTELLLDRGMMEIVDLHIDGPASAFAFSGSSDLNSGDIDGELVVTLPLANNLPWVAALAAGPAVAAGVFVVSKVFEKQVNRMSSAVYGVTGDMASPAVEFRRLFDDSVNPELEGALRPEIEARADSETGGG